MPVQPGCDGIFVGGGGVTAVTSKLRPALAGPMLPAASVARTWKVCIPTGSPVAVYGDVQRKNAPVSRRHSNRAPASGEENVNVGGLPVGPSPTTICGETESSTYALPLGEQAETLPAASVARA